MGDPLNLNDSTAMVLEARNCSSSPVKVSLALVNKEGTYFESRQVKLPPGNWQRLNFPLTGDKAFKTISDSHFTSPLKGRGHITRLILFVYGHRDIELEVDGIFFSRNIGNMKCR